MTRQHPSPTRPPAHRTLSASVALGLLLALAGCAKPPSPTIRVEPPVPTQSGQASWYSDSLQGRTTASGEPYDRNALTAAHRDLPFGTRVRVTRTENGHSVVVRINDRGPFVKGRIIDLSRRAAEELDMIADGVVPVRLAVLD